MDYATTALSFIREIVLLVSVFGALLVYAVIRGQRRLISLILGLYVALLLSLEFPYYTYFFAHIDFLSDTVIRLSLFAFFTAFGSVFFERLTSRLLDESAIEGIGKKVVLALLGTALILSYSYHILHITNFIDPGAKIALLFSPPQYFFWWFIAPLVGIFLLF